MQGHQKPLNVKTAKELESLIGPKKAREERLGLAKKFKFLAQQNNPHVRLRVGIDEVKFQRFYSEHKKAFDKLHFILRKYLVDEDEFLKYSLDNINVFTPEFLIKSEVFRRYADKKSRDEKYDYIFEMYMKTVRFVAEMSLKIGITPKEFLLLEFSENRIAYDFMAGKISKYFIASIKNFKKIYWTLDNLNKDELRIIYDALDELRVMANESFFRKTGNYPRPILDSEAELTKLKEKQLTKENE